MPNRKKEETLCEIYYASINFRDVMVATGRLASDAIMDRSLDRECVLGCEFAGRLVGSRKRVMGAVSSKALATTIIVNPSTCWEIPEKWTLEEAATIPVVYCTAYFALIVRGKLRKGEKVLIHSGSGGVGLAAISIALAHQCEVFTTVGSEEKRVFLKKRFPQLKEDHFSNSRTTEFEAHFMKVTKGRGVDIVLNSLSEEKLQASVRCLALFGRFLEIGKYDLANNSALGMEFFLRNAEFHGIVLESAWEATNGDWEMVQALMKEGLQNGVVEPLPTTVFSSQDQEAAFRYMAGGTHKGKVLIEIRKEEKEDVVAGPVRVKAVCRTYCHPQRTYLITGGLGGVGLELANWLVHRGAKKLILTSRSGVRTGYQKRIMNQWEKLGISVTVSTADFSREDECNALIKECEAAAPMGGIFHLAMVLKDGMFENQSVEHYKETAITKYHGTINLDRATRKYCGDKLKWFVGFSSIVSGRGNPGQTSYGWGNAAMERVIEERRLSGLAGMVIQWGAIGDVGVILENKMGSNATEIGGTLPQRVHSVLHTLDAFLSWDHPIVSSYVRADTGRKSDGNESNIVAIVSKILGVTDPSQLDPDTSFVDLGLDSLMGMEIRQAVERQLALPLSMKEILNMTLNKLGKLSKGEKYSDEKLASPTANADPEEVEQNLLDLFRLEMDITEALPKTCLVPINEVREGEPVYFVHTMEGIAGPLRPLATHLPVPAFCFQCVPDAPLDSIPSLAHFYLSKLKEQKPTGPYHLVGYSYGAGIAFEMATILQKEEPTAVASLTIIDGSHHYAKIYRDMYRKAYGIDEKDLFKNPLFESEIITNLAMRFATFEYAVLRDKLVGLKSWEARVEAGAVQVMASGIIKDPHVFQFICNGVRGRFVAADNYFPGTKFQGNLTLLRASHSAAKEEDVGRDYGLQVVTNGEVKVEILDGDHANFVKAGAKDAAGLIMKALAIA